MRSILYGDLATLIDDEPRTVMVPVEEGYDWHAEVIEQSVALNMDCFGTPEDVVVRYRRP